MAHVAAELHVPHHEAQAEVKAAHSVVETGHASSPEGPQPLLMPSVAGAGHMSAHERT